MRSVDEVVWNSFYKHLSKRQLELASVQQKVGTGKKITRPSEAPVDMLTIIRIKAAQAGYERQNKRLESIRWMINNTSAIYENVNDVLTEIEGIALNALSGTKTQEDKLHLARQIESFAEQVIIEASSKHLGDYLLGEFTSAKEDGWSKFEKVKNPARANAYINSSTEMDLIPEDTIINILNELTSFCKAIEQGNDDSAREIYAGIQDERNLLIEQNGILGTKELFLDSLIERNIIRISNIDVQRVSLEEVDIAEVAMELANAERGYEMAIEVASRLENILDPTKLFK